MRADTEMCISADESERTKSECSLKNGYVYLPVLALRIVGSANVWGGETSVSLPTYAPVSRLAAYACVVSSGVRFGTEKFISPSTLWLLLRMAAFRLVNLCTVGFGAGGS
jgi:hypothetical protein